MSAGAPVDKRYLCEHFVDILARGCLPEPARQEFLETGDAPGIFVTQTSGSSGAPPLRVPRTQEEMFWLGSRIYLPFAERYGALPSRTALLGGISHMDADQKVRLDGAAMKNFRGDQLAELAAYDPDFLSLYPSFLREVLAQEELRLPRLRAFKLGGERVFPADLERLFARFPDVLVIEQFGSTEMPGIAFRHRTRETDSGYLLSTDRFDFDLEAPVSSDGFRPLIVRDRFEERAFPIPDWFLTEDEVRVEAGAVVELRRREDPSYVWRHEVDALYARGCVQVQLWTEESLAYATFAAGRACPPSRSLGGREYRLVNEPPFRLRDSNKLPLCVDSRRLPRERLWRGP